MAIKRLYRSRKDRILGGVCSGLAEYFQVDVSLVRLLTLLIFFLGGVGFIIYLLAWFIIPEAPAADSTSTPSAKEEERQEEREGGERSEPGRGGGEAREEPQVESSGAAAGRTLGLILVVLGLVFLAHNLWPWMQLWYLWPLALVAGGLYLLLRPSR